MMVGTACTIQYIFTFRKTLSNGNVELEIMISDLGQEKILLSCPEQQELQNKNYENTVVTIDFKH